MVRIVTWNVNSIKARLPNVLDWLRTGPCDVLLLQELKCQDDAFPRLEFETLGYRALVHGQKSYNGIAILSRLPIGEIRRGLPGGEGDDQARYLEAAVAGLRVASLYLPNGNPAPGDKFDYKLAWMDRLINHTKSLLAEDIPFVLGGDYNVCPSDADVYAPEDWQADALCRPESRGAYRRLLHLGLTDAFRALHPERPRAYTFWD
ncbi:MAG: exodeoxyribonuclease III, partial [Magnetospirillum sp.]|nr:exodeoxyribonuclease III [Magnetospirillum sp.]